MKPCTLADDGLTFVSMTGDKPNRRMVTHCVFHKNSCRFTLFVEDPEGFIKHDGGRFMYERAAATAEALADIPVR